MPEFRPEQPKPDHLTFSTKPNRGDFINPLENEDPLDPKRIRKSEKIINENPWPPKDLSQSAREALGHPSQQEMNLPRKRKGVIEQALDRIKEARLAEAAADKRRREEEHYERKHARQAEISGVEKINKVKPDRE